MKRFWLVNVYRGSTVVQTFPFETLKEARKFQKENRDKLYANLVLGITKSPANLDGFAIKKKKKK